MATPAVFEKDALRVGTVVKGGKRFTFDRARLQRYARSVNELTQEGLRVPLVNEHTDPADASGKEGPQSSRKKAAAGVENGAGWVTGARVEGDVLKLKLEVPNKKTAEKLRTGEIKFVSPDLRGEWTSPVSGHKYKDVLYNVALTHHPVGQQTDQFSEVLQLSMADYEDAQLADDEEDKDPTESGEESSGGSETVESVPDGPEANANSEESNPDMPDANDTPESEKKLQLCMAWLAKMDIPMQSDTTMDNFVDRLTTALMAIDATMQKMDEEDASEDQDEQDDAPPVEEQPQSLMQFSESHPAVKRLVETHRRIDRKRIASLQGRLGKKLAERLTKQVDTLQLSEDLQAERPSLTLSDLLDIVEAIPTVDLTKDHTVQLSEHKHPRDSWYGGTDGLGRREGESETDEAKRVFKEEADRMRRMGLGGAVSIGQ